MTSESRSRREWIEHRYFRTYRIAAEFDAIANGAFDARELESLMVDDGVLDFVAPWQKDNAALKLARWIAHRFFYEETDGPYAVDHIFQTDKGVEVVRNLPVDLALLAYGFDHKPFSIPPPDGEVVRTSPNTTMWKESDKVANLCYDYFTEELQWSAPYDELLHRIGEEVFHIVFMNRAAMAGLNWLVAAYLNTLDSDTLNANPHNVVVSRQDGKLSRRRIPKWVKRAVYFREHGRCASCGRDLSGLIDSLPAQQFDHIVPLASGGLNDVTNIQLLCQSCNGVKSDTAVAPSESYRSWYELGK